MILYVPERTKVCFQFKTCVSLMHTNWHPVIRVVSSLLFKNCCYFRKSDWVIFVTGSDSLHYCYDVSYQSWFASEEAKIYCNNFNSSNAVVCSHLILAYTVRLAIMNAVELERNGCCCCFFYLYWGNVVLWLKRTSTKKLANRISYQIWYKGCLKGTFGRGSKSAKGGLYPLADLDRGGSKSAVTPGWVK